MKKVKKLLVLLLMLCCIGGVCACGGQNSDQPDDQKPPIVDPNPPEQEDNERTVTYHLNGGEGKLLDIFTVGEGLSALPVPTKKGMTFIGWYRNMELTGDKVESISAEETGNVELWAKYSHNTYSVSADNTNAPGVTFVGEGSAVHGTDYMFTVTFTEDQPLTVGVTVGGEKVDCIKNANGSYTVSGDDITGDLAVTLSFNHVWLHTTPADHVVYGEDTMAERNKPYTFSVSAEKGYKITDVTVTEEGGTQLPVNKNADGTYTVSVAEKAITVAATAEEISYNLQLSYGQDKTLSLGSVKYSDLTTLTEISNISDFNVPEHYEFLGWATEDGGMPVYDDGASVSKLSSEDGATVTLYAIMRGEEYTVSGGTLIALEFAEEQDMTAHYGEDFVFAFKDSAGYYLDLTVSVDGTDCAAEYDEETNTYTIAKEHVTGNIVISGEKFVAAPNVYEGITQKIEILDVFQNNNSYTVAAALRQDGIYFKSNITQNSITQDPEKSEENLVFVDAIRFVFGKKDGTALTSVPNNCYFGVNVCGRVEGLDRGLCKVSGEKGNYTIVYEGFVSYETLVSRGVLGYTAEDFTGEAYKTAQIYCGVRLINPQNFKTAADAIATPNAQDGIESRGSQGIIVSADGSEDVKGNCNVITENGIQSLLSTEGVDGVVDENEYGEHELVYTDTDTERGNKLEIFGKKTDKGLRIAVRVTSRSVIYYNGQLKSQHDALDHIMLTFYKQNGEPVNLFLWANGRMEAAAPWLAGFAFRVNIDKSQAGRVSNEHTNSQNAYALVAESGKKLITTYEVFLPYGYKDGVFENGAVYVKVRHRVDQTDSYKDDYISYEGKNKWSTVWEYTNNEDVSWPHLSKVKSNLFVTEGGIYDLRRTVRYDNTATGNNGKSFTDYSANAHYEVELPDVGQPKVGYRFLGWSLSENGDILEKGYTLPIDYLSDADGNVTFYARYEEAVYNLTVSDDGNRIDTTAGAENQKVKLWQDYTVTVKASTEGKVTTVQITVGGKLYVTRTDKNSYTVTVPGKDITGDIVVTVSETEAEIYDVIFAQDDWATITGEDTAYKGAAYLFTIDDQTLVGAAKCNGKEIPVNNLGNGNFSIDADYVMGDLTIRAKQPVILEDTQTFELHRNDDEMLHVYAPEIVENKDQTVVKVSVDGKEITDGATYDENAGGFRIDTQKFDVPVGDTVHTLTIETVDIVYTQTFKLVTMIIMNKEELLLVKTKYFQGTYEGHAGSVSSEALRDGYFVLGADINKDGEYFEFTMSPTFTGDGTGSPNGEEGNRMSWFGVFDGAGHTIYNVQTGMGGMFGILRSPASAIRNLAVVGGKVVMGGKLVWQSNGEDSGKKFEGGEATATGFLTRSVKGATIENVYIEIVDIPQVNKFAVIASTVFANEGLGTESAVLKNIVVNVQDCTTSAADRYATFGASGGNPTVEGVFAYGEIELTFGAWTTDSTATVKISRNTMNSDIIKASNTLNAAFAGQINGKGSFTVQDGKLLFSGKEIGTIVN